MISPDYTRNPDVIERTDSIINVGEEINFRLTKACLVDGRTPVKA